MVNKKEGMTKEDILKKLRSLKKDEWKLEYLTDLEKRSNLLRPDTRKAFYEILGDLFIKVRPYCPGENRPGGMDYIEKAACFYKNAGLNNKAKEILLDKAEKNFYGELVYFQSEGEMPGYKRSSEKEATARWEKYLINAGLTKSETYAKMAKKFQETGHSNLAAKYYEKAGLSDKADSMLQKESNNDNSPSLEGKVAIVGITASFLASLIFLSSNMTGNTILNSSFKLSNFLGVGLFILAVVGAFLYIRKNKKVEVKRKVVKKKVKSKAKKKKN